MLSNSCRYGIRAVIYLASQPHAATKTGIKQISADLGLPTPFLAKILQELAHKGILLSTKGPRGGFGLAKPSNQITMLEIVEAVAGTAFTNGCVLGFMECTVATPCAMHDQWSGIRERIIGALGNQDLGEMARRMRKPEYTEA